MYIEVHQSDIVYACNISMLIMCSWWWKPTQLKHISHINMSNWIISQTNGNNKNPLKPAPRLKKKHLVSIFSSPFIFSSMYTQIGSTPLPGFQSPPGLLHGLGSGIPT